MVIFFPHWYTPRRNPTWTYPDLMKIVAAFYRLRLGFENLEQWIAIFNMPIKERFLLVTKKLKILDPLEVGTFDTASSFISFNKWLKVRNCDKKSVE